MDVPALESTQQEADTRIILHTLYSVQNEGVDRVVIHASDTDIITMCLHCGATYLSDLPELSVRAAQNADLPIHEMVVAVGPSRCCALHPQSEWQRCHYLFIFYCKKKGIVQE